ncbi:serine/threonine-protein phosphatase [Planosporangium flavigriseum]|uniref:PP2C family protein-serine/threonine phosphatase n=1 Tax=Planosporangium flavigriseum TaxID=373681 RepID=UPI00143C3251|nr:protein phosphatase 2C domain-containing protein [Planosporangium flavigriseum]NJC63428.1 serine/threonine-protein phosphatase [Planosporangium flavigriseum]
MGLVRRRNEDAMYVGRSLFAVADGLGGHPAGNIASAAAIEALPHYDRPVDPADLPATLGRAVRAANEALRHKIEAEPQLAGMGTTLVALLWSGTAAILANVGDSRVYLLRDGGTVQITEDHTYGHLVADAANVPNLPERLSRWLDGRADGRSPDLSTWDMRPGDRFLLCSDGLSSYVPFDLINATLRSPSDPNEVADRLITLAIDHGGSDNVTVVVIDVREYRVPPDA